MADVPVESRGSHRPESSCMIFGPVTRSVASGQMVFLSLMFAKSNDGISIEGKDADRFGTAE